MVVQLRSFTPFFLSGHLLWLVFLWSVAPHLHLLVCGLALGSRLAGGVSPPPLPASTGLSRAGWLTSSPLTSLRALAPLDGLLSPPPPPPPPDPFSADWLKAPLTRLGALPPLEGLLGTLLPRPRLGR